MRIRRSEQFQYHSDCIQLFFGAFGRGWHPKRKKKHKIALTIGSSSAPNLDMAMANLESSHMLSAPMWMGIHALVQHTHTL